MKLQIVVALALILSACSSEPAYQSKALEIFPNMPIKNVALFRMDALGVTQEFFVGQWTAVGFAESQCDSMCHQRLAELNQFKTGHALLVFTDFAGHELMRGLKNAYPNVEISMGATASSLDVFIEQFNDSTIDTEQRADYLYLVNPDSVLTHAVLAPEVNPGDLDREVAVIAAAG